MLIKDQFGIIQNLQMAPIHETSFLVWTFFTVQQTGSKQGPPAHIKFKMALYP